MTLERIKNHARKRESEIFQQCQNLVKIYGSPLRDKFPKSLEDKNRFNLYLWSGIHELEEMEK